MAQRANEDNKISVAEAPTESLTPQMQELVKFIEDRERQVTFSAEDMAAVFDRASADVVNRHDGLPEEAMPVWICRITTELILAEERKRFIEHGRRPCPNCHPATRHLQPDAEAPPVVSDEPAPVDGSP